jgi:drug/metabolite transporter (DMT)-like permease
VAASLFAAFCYAVAGIYLRRKAAQAPPLAVAGWSQLAGSLLLVPGTLIAWFPDAASAPLDPVLLVDVVALGLLCSGIAYLLYYRLMRDVGPTRSLTVTFLIPLFAMIWAWLFLREEITPTMLVGCAFVIGGTLAVLRGRSAT